MKKFKSLDGADRIFAAGCIYLERRTDKYSNNILEMFTYSYIIHREKGFHDKFKTVS